MSETTIFIIGAVIFAITVYGSVMAGGLALTRIGIRESDAPDHGVGLAPDAPAAAVEEQPAG